MGKTVLGINGIDFTINRIKTYSDIAGTNPDTHGLLMNARFIQGIFDDKSNPDRFSRFGYEWDPTANTNRLIAALPEWKQFGLLGFTVGMQGGMPVLTIPNHSIDNNPYSEDGKHIDTAYLERLDRLIKAADEVGMVVIVSLLYQGQVNRMKDGRCIRRAVETSSSFLKDSHYTNVIIEVANEYNVGNFKNHPLVYYPEGIVTLIDLARYFSGEMPVGSSGGGLHFSPEVCQASDVILVHGNGATLQTYYNMIRDIQALKMNRPIICNEDSPRFSQLTVARHTHTSWGYYNNHTKQEPPADWRITPGEDTYFAWRMAYMLDLPTPELSVNEQFYLQGFEKHATYQGKRWIRLSSLFPEHIACVEFYRNGKLFDIAYEEPFYTHHRTTWIQDGVELSEKVEEWEAFIHLHSGQVIKKRQVTDLV